MNEVFNSIVFYPVSVLIIIFSILAIKFDNIFYSLLSAIVVFFLVGVIFYILGSEYNAVIQIAVYGVAVPVILGLAVMFTDSGKKRKEENKSKINVNYLTLICSGVFILALIYLIMTSYLVIPEGFNLVENFSESSFQTITAFAKGIFIRYVWAFELVSIILTIIVVGLTLNREEDECQK